MENKAQSLSAMKDLNRANQEIDLISIHRRRSPETKIDRNETRKKQRKIEIDTLTVASVILNVVMAVIIYILQAGPI